MTQVNGESANVWKSLIRTKILDSGVSRIDAVRTLLSEYRDSQLLKSALPWLEKELDNLLDRAKLIASATRSSSAQEDHEGSGWYSGPEEGKIWTSLHQAMLDSPLNEAVDTIDTESTQIVSSLAKPRRSELKLKKKGLVVGHVQSGKTANYAAVIAKALDAGYQVVIVLSGIHNNLRSQTQQRLDRDLGHYEGTSWIKLTGEEGDISRVAKRQSSATRTPGNKTIGVIKKQKQRLEALKDFFKSINEIDRKELPVLIIDDESDQATPDGSRDPDSDPTTINRLVREIWSLVKLGTYVGYTATPFANVFMNPDANGDNDGELEDLYPSDFIFALSTSSSYFGAERIFGIAPFGMPTHEIDSGDSVTEYPDYSDGMDVVRYASEDDAAVLIPRGMDIESFDPHATSTLKAAIDWFIVACAIRLHRGQNRSHSSMLVHTTHRAHPHFQIKETIASYISEVKRSIHNDDWPTLENSFASEYFRTLKYAPDKYRHSEIQWNEIKGFIPEVLEHLTCVVDNGLVPRANRLQYTDLSDSTEKPLYVIVVGGGTLSRGLTLEGLFVSYFLRSSNAYDTLLQMGRWFGYRSGFEDLQRIWTTPDLERNFRWLSGIEAELRASINEMIDRRMKPQDIGIRIRQDPKARLQITSAAKMKHTYEATDFGGRSGFETTVLSIHRQQTDHNLQLVNRLLRNISNHHVQTSPDINGELFIDVNVRHIMDFASKFITNNAQGEYNQAAVSWSQDKLPRKSWNVVIAGGRAPDMWELPISETTVLRVKPVNRAPLKHSQDLATGQVDFRSLSPGASAVHDIRLLQHATDPSIRLPEDTLKEAKTVRDFKDLRHNHKLGDGRGLLVLYPISRLSKRAPENEARIDLIDALLRENPGARRLELESEGPILGYSLVTPSDTEGVLSEKERGSFSFVVPTFISDEDDLTDIRDEPITDNEGDYDVDGSGTLG